MQEYDIQRCSRRCAASGRELRDGEVCFSVLVAEGGQVVRYDYAAEAWSGPPEGAIGWWRTTVADPQAGRMTWAPHDVMLSYFERLLDDPAAEDARYVLALLLVRRRVLELERHEQDAAGRTVLVLHCPRTEAEYRVVERLPSPDRAEAIQSQLVELLRGAGGAQAAAPGQAAGPGEAAKQAEAAGPASSAPLARG
jgi:hypothetical protein